MNRGQRIAILVVAVVVLVGGFVLAQGSGNEEEQATEQVAEQTAQDGGTETAEGPGGEQAPPPETETGPRAEEPEPKPEPRVETIRIRDGRPASGEARTITWKSGDTVRMRFTADAPTEIHIHGYDRYVNVAPGDSETARFKAEAEGIFEVEVHGTGALVAKLEVRP